jgi:hypothetical protein
MVARSAAGGEPEFVVAGVGVVAAATGQEQAIGRRIRRSRPRRCRRAWLGRRGRFACACSGAR